jgi:7-keto-8-aminopelargonate synthetase-like enzyme
MEDLERVLQGVVNGDRKYDQSLSQRRMIIVEGVYANSGALVPLPRVVELAAKYVYAVWYGAVWCVVWHWYGTGVCVCLPRKWGAACKCVMLAHVGAAVGCD